MCSTDNVVLIFSINLRGIFLTIRHNYEIKLKKYIVNFRCHGYQNTYKFLRNN